MPETKARLKGRIINEKAELKELRNVLNDLEQGRCSIGYSQLIRKIHYRKGLIYGLQLAVEFIEDEEQAYK